MGWAKFDDRRHTNGKLIAAGLAANGLDANGITYCSANETDGFIPDDVLIVLAPLASNRQRTVLAAALVAVGRWRRDDDMNGWWIHDYLKFNPARADLEERREADRLRKAAQKRNGAGQFRLDSGSVPAGTSLDSRSVPPDPVPSRPDPSPPVPREIVTSPNNCKSVGPPSGETREEDFSPAREGTLRDLIGRLANACTAENRRRVNLEAALVVGLCQTHAPIEVLEEAVSDAVAGKPVLPRFLLEAFKRRCRAHGLPAPMLNHELLGRPA